MTNADDLFYFKCSVSEDLYGVSPNADGAPLPTPGGGSWLPLDNKNALGKAAPGFKVEAASADLSQWGCHWFSSKGPVDIIWGKEMPPVRD